MNGEATNARQSVGMPEHERLGTLIQPVGRDLPSGMLERDVHFRIIGVGMAGTTCPDATTTAMIPVKTHRAGRCAGRCAAGGDLRQWPRR